MAKKKKYRPKRKAHTARSHSRRRRVGASATKLNANSMIVKVGAVAAGYFFGDKITAPIKKAIGDKVDSKIVAGVEGLAGYYLAFKKGKKNMVQVIAGCVLAGDAIKSLMASFGVGGIGPYGRLDVINGYGNLSVVNGRPNVSGYSPSRSLNGYSPNRSLNRASSTKIMGSVDSGSGVTNSGGGSFMD